MARRIAIRERLTDGNISRWTNGRLTTVAEWQKEQAAKGKPLKPGSRRMFPARTMPRKRSLAERQIAVRIAWDLHEGAEPDISTERLMMMVADDTGEDYGDVAALYQGENPDEI